MSETSRPATHSAATGSTPADAAPPADPPRASADEFARQAEEAPPGLLAEFWDFLLHNKKWWLIPIILVLLAFSVLAFLSGTAAAPFIYPGI